MRVVFSNYSLMKEKSVNAHKNKDLYKSNNSQSNSISFGKAVPVVPVPKNISMFAKTIGLVTLDKGLTRYAEEIEQGALVYNLRSFISGRLKGVIFTDNKGVPKIMNLYGLFGGQKRYNYSQGGHVSSIEIYRRNKTLAQVRNMYPDTGKCNRIIKYAGDGKTPIFEKGFDVNTGRDLEKIWYYPDGTINTINIFNEHGILSERHIYQYDELTGKLDFIDYLNVYNPTRQTRIKREYFSEDEQLIKATGYINGEEYQEIVYNQGKYAKVTTFNSDDKTLKYVDYYYPDGETIRKVENHRGDGIVSVSEYNLSGTLMCTWDFVDGNTLNYVEYSVKLMPAT